MNQQLWLFCRGMKSALILVAMHVLNALLVVSSANTVNSNKNATNAQTYSNHYNNMCTLSSSSNTQVSYYLDYMSISKTWKCVQCPQNYKLTILSSVEIFNKGSMVLENESIRFPPSMMLANTKHCKIKMTAMNILRSTSGASPNFFKLTFKTMSHRLNEKKNIIIKKICIQKKKYTQNKNCTLEKRKYVYFYQVTIRWRNDCIYDIFDFKKTELYWRIAKNCTYQTITQERVAAVCYAIGKLDAGK
ncbi:hypothetical protein RFI_22916 [Reticulomyxa filosa]|uniref:Uncharacterized protein n=1 Tax=Reticulomyxa filosa TaxID=46433 RepID=X6MLE7_RETFI|nr:hypothetical protein RFI_22916 [Reticulomyxa filosa]|eukprot:ETO14451.1 hypothetical protein RFI_22916 [Reticulomyxa filosa]